MSKDIYNKPGYVQTLQEDGFIHVIWEKLFDAASIYESCKAQLAEVQNGNCKVVIVDVKNAAGTPPQECQEWFVNELFPGFGKSPTFKALINVLPANAITKMGANRWKTAASSGQFGFDTYETDSAEAAKELARKL